MGGDISTGDLPSIAPFSEEKFDELVAEMVTYEAPRLFAVVQVYGDRIDARIAGWGIAFEDHTEIFSEERIRMSLQSPTRAIHLFSRTPNVTARLVWVRPPHTGSTPTDNNTVTPEHGTAAADREPFAPVGGQ